ncbi:MAG: hypothetical protein LBS06_05170 [Treponema sp.]|jgi:hypothetical protein|nr:hypothetical protein [Treponema sp.]
MAKDGTNLEVLSTRSGFNSAVRQIKKTIGVVDAVGQKNNLGDILHELGDEDLSGGRAALLLNMLLVDRLGYRTVSTNLSSVSTSLGELATEFSKWKAVDLVAAYHHPEMGLLVANPKNGEELAGFGELRKRELLVIYAGKGDAPPDDLCRKAAELAAVYFEGGQAKVPQELYKGGFAVRTLKKEKGEDSKAEAPAGKGRAPKKARAAVKAGREPVRRGPPPRSGAPAAPVAEAQRAAPPVVTASSALVAASKGPVRMTPKYAVVVQNELFHNGNVEAWKRIIASYNAKYPSLQVYIYYEGERILDINSLFKWGKVKHGSAIEFAVAGAEIKDVAKLQRYLAQGASHQFEAFLHGPVNTILRLF